MKYAQSVFFKVEGLPPQPQNFASAQAVCSRKFNKQFQRMPANAVKELFKLRFIIGRRDKNVFPGTCYANLLMCVKHKRREVQDKKSGIAKGPATYSGCRSERICSVHIMMAVLRSSMAIVVMYQAVFSKAFRYSLTFA